MDVDVMAETQATGVQEPLDGAEPGAGAPETATPDAAAEELAFEVGLPPVELSVAAQIESLLFVADEAVAISDLVRVLELSRARILRALDALETEARSRGVRLQREEGRVRLVTAPEAAGLVQRFLGLEHAQRLSRAALETLSIVAYRQPLTRPEIDALRGVSSDGVLRTLVGRELVEPVGRRDTVGHPVEYGTTGRFLEYFGLTALEELPPIDLPTPGADVAAEVEWAPFGGGRPDALTMPGRSDDAIQQTEAGTVAGTVAGSVAGTEDSAEVDEKPLDATNAA